MRICLLGLFSLLFCFLAVPLTGEVFTLWPFKGGGTTAAGSLYSQIPGAGEVLLRENMRVNGVDLVLRVSAVHESYPVLLEFLARMFQPENLAVSAGQARVAYQVGDGMVERWLLVDAGPGKPVTLFSVTAPEKMGSPLSWPAELPSLPGGAKPAQVIYFTDRKAVYGAFERALDDRGHLLRNVTDQLKNDGWVAVGNEANLAEAGSGDLFILPGKRRLMWVAYGESGTGICYTRPY